MTNPNNAIGTNAAYNGRTSVNAFNDSLTAYNRGIMSGWECVPNSGLTVSVGGTSGIRDVAVAEDNAGNKTTINNISAQPVNVTLAVAPVTNSRIDLIVVYVDGSPQGTSNVADNPGACGIVAVKGTASATPSVPSDATIRAAITADGAAGSTAYYTILAQITIEHGTTDITSAMIESGNKSNLALIGSVVSTPTSLAYIDTVNIIDGAVTAAKIDLASIGLDYSTSEVNTGAKWIDGSSIYKKTFHFPHLPSSDGLLKMEHNIANLKTAIKYDGVMRNIDNIDRCWDLSYRSVNMECDKVYVTLSCYFGASLADYEAYVTLYYTKTS